MRHSTTFAMMMSIAAYATIGATAAAKTWMSEDAMRTDFVGQTLDGHYGSGLNWTESYANNGRLDYREGARRASGSWSFRGPVFCTFYDPVFRGVFSGGCWQVLKTSANCYEFFTAARAPGATGPDRKDDGDDSAEPGARTQWNARGWRRDQPSTCEDKPSV